MGDDGTAAVIFDSTGLKRVVERTVLPFYTPLENEMFTKRRLESTVTEWFEGRRMKSVATVLQNATCT